MIPETFEQWEYCIVHDCKIKLDKDYAKSRLVVYEDTIQPETMKFKQLYGAAHLQNIISWFKKI